MRKSRVVWNVSLSVDGRAGDGLLKTIARILRPVEKIEISDDHGLMIRNYGLYCHVLTEPYAELTAGEIAMNCLVKAHGLATAWHFRWPLPVIQDRKEFWTWEEIEKSRLPASMEGFPGGFSDGFTEKSLFHGLNSASFRVEIE